MCAPMLGMVMGIGQAVLSVASASAQHSAAMADYNAKAAVWRQNVVNSQAAARDEQRQIITRQLQEQEKTSQKIHVSFLEEAQKRSTAEVSAASAGVTGISVDNILNDITAKSALNRSYAERNYKYVAQDITEQLQGTYTKMMSRINSVERPVEPSSAPVAIAAAGAGLKLFGTMGGMG